MAVDLGESRRLAINHCDLHNGEAGFLRNWDLQGALSMAGPWTLLKRHGVPVIGGVPETDDVTETDGVPETEFAPAVPDESIGDHQYEAGSWPVEAGEKGAFRCFPVLAVREELGRTRLPVLRRDRALWSADASLRDS